MGKYERRTRPGWMLYHENLPMLEALPPEDVKALIIALTRYSIALANDEPPPNFSSVANPMAQATLAPRIEKDSDAYKSKCEKGALYRSKQKSTAVDRGQLELTKADGGRVIERNSSELNVTHLNGAELNDTSAEHSRVEVERNFCGGSFDLNHEAERRARGKYDNASKLDIQRELRDLQHAEQLARKYGLPQNPAVYCSMLDDVEKFGWEKLEDALKEAAAANSRGGLSINFYRAVLQNGAKPTNRGISLSHCRDL